MPEQDILAVKREKLKTLQDEGRDPFQITKYDVTHHALDIKNGFEDLEDSTVRVAGRMMFKRKMGKASFCNCMDRSGKYYVSLLYEYPASESQTAGKESRDMDVLGIDFAMQGMAVFSDGSRAEYPMYYRKAQERLAREQRKLSHCKKGSRNYDRQRKVLARCHEKVRNQRRDYLHKLSRGIADRYDAAAVEDIDMKAMSRCLKFGKSVMDDSYGAFRDMLAYKLEEQGKELVKVDRFFPSSKMCSRCGNVKKELGLDERTYHCGCGNCMDRDVNAAVNIREEGRRILKTA